MIKGMVLAILLSATIGQAWGTEISNYTREKLQRELPVLDLAVGDAVLLRTFKKESRLELWMQGQGKTAFTLFRTYPICFYSGGLGPKRHQGDKITPEGFYRITLNDLNPNSRFHLAMDIGYPNAYDRSLGRNGSLLLIHGACDSTGCFAMGNAQVEEIYYLVEQALTHGQSQVPVHAFPFHLTLKNLSAYQGNQWYDFWTQLKAGYDAFNASKQPPSISVENGRYQVSDL